MKRTLIILFAVFLSFSFLQAEQKKPMTKAEFMKLIMEQEKEKKELAKRRANAKAKTKATKELRKSVEKLANTLGVDK